MSDRIAKLLPDTHLLAILAQTRSFTQAAGRLGISKASVSMRVRDLERAMGELVSAVPRLDPAAPNPVVVLYQHGLGYIAAVRGPGLG